MIRTAMLLATGMFAILLIAGCQGQDQNRDNTSGGSAQVGSGTDTGTTGVSSGEVSPATQPAQ